LRLFVAIEVPAEKRAGLGEVVEALAPRWPGARWVEPANQHVTLKFLGSTPPERLPAVREICRTVANRHAGSQVRVAGIGAFPNLRRARVLWAGVEDPRGLLARLAGELTEEFRVLGYEPEARPFSAHLTLARFKQPVHIREELSLAGDFAWFPVARLTLFRSRPSPRGARYEKLDTFALA
jgi:RNA 2',3'-cyclic 3'-phosphodiesterase